MPTYNANNLRHRSLGPGAHTQGRAVFFRVQYDPIQRDALKYRGSSGTITTLGAA